MLFPNARPATATLTQPVCSLVIDAEEDFDWQTPRRGTPYRTTSMRQIRDLQEIVGAYGVRPTYLLTYPVLEEAAVTRILDRTLDRNECDVGVQLHPWVNPPFGSETGEDASFLSSLSPELEEGKLVALKSKFERCFGRAPRVFRAGRYGLSEHTTRFLEKHGFTVDTSLAPRTRFATHDGPDFLDYDCDPFWFGGSNRLLELPLCRSVIGWGGALAPLFYRVFSTPCLSRLRMPAVLSRLRCAERITLSPEGNDHAAMVRLLFRKLACRQNVYSLSFHSSSLAVGCNPYVQTKTDLHTFYDRLSAILDTMASRLGFGFATPAEIPALLGEAEP